MSLMMLLLTSILLVAGLSLLPPVTGSGLDSVFARAWLLFGILVFLCHYHRYLAATGKEMKRQEQATVHRDSVRPAARNAAHR